jgi:hypothetical protein
MKRGYLSYIEMFHIHVVSKKTTPVLIAYSYLTTKQILFVWCSGFLGV